MVTRRPASLKDPTRHWEPGLAVTAQLTLLPKVEADAQLRLELVDAGGQSVGVGVTVIVPEDASGLASTMLVLRA
jgi:hypothetical protein